MYGKNEPAKIKRFRFDSSSETAKEDFDKAVKELNIIYKTNGRFDTKEEILEYFKNMGSREFQYNSKR